MVKLGAGKGDERIAEESKFNPLRAELAGVGPYVVLQSLDACAGL